MSERERTDAPRTARGAPIDAPPGEIVERILRAAEPYEFRTFVVGLERPPRGEEGAPRAERRLKTAIGTELHRRWPLRGADFERPEMRFNVRRDLEIECHPAPLFLAGRYRKLSRKIPASRWMHLPCKGLGCPACRYTGNLCGPSIQEIFSEPLLELAGGRRTFFHGLGREDTDARMLGEGRPFVLEVERPLRRSIDYERLLAETAAAGEGLCELLEPAVVDRNAVPLVKETAAEKTYRAWIRFEAVPPHDSAARAEALGGVTIEQYSPERVMHRRGISKVRRKRVVATRWLGEVDRLTVWEVRAEAGTYIKELISGDGGRTRPSLAEALGVPLVCVALDVLAVHWTPPWAEEATA